MRTLERLPATPPALADVGQALVGRYSVPELDAHARIDFDGDALLLRIASAFGPNVLTLQAYGANIFGWNHVGELAALGGTLYVERGEAEDEGKGKVSGLRLNTLRTRHMLFRRLDD